MLPDCYGSTQSAKKQKAEGEKKDKHRCWEKSSKLFLLISADKLVEPIRTERGSRGQPATFPACSCTPGCVWAAALSMNSPLLAPGHHPEQGHSLCSHMPLGKAKDAFLGSSCTQNNFKWLKEMNYRIWKRTWRIKQQLLRITMLKKQPAKTDFIVKPQTVHICLLQHKAKFWVKAVIYV